MCVCAHTHAVRARAEFKWRRVNKDMLKAATVAADVDVNVSAAASAVVVVCPPPQ